MITGVYRNCAYKDYSTRKMYIHYRNIQFQIWKFSKIKLIIKLFQFKLVYKNVVSGICTTWWRHMIIFMHLMLHDNNLFNWNQKKTLAWFAISYLQPILWSPAVLLRLLTGKPSVLRHAMWQVKHLRLTALSKQTEIFILFHSRVSSSLVKLIECGQ